MNQGNKRPAPPSRWEDALCQPGKPAERTFGRGHA